MTMTYLPDSGLVQVVSPEIDNLFTNLVAYEYVIITGTMCNATPVVLMETIEEMVIEGAKFQLSQTEAKLFISPSFFGLTSFQDTVLNLSIKIKKSTGWTVISNCIFIDINYKCKVAALLQNIIFENKTAEESEKLSTNAHLLHYALFNGSNCGCNCEEMCEVFLVLKKILDNIDPKMLNDCGC